MSRPIGYYVHHQGDGHRQRALAIARAADCPITVLGTGLAGRTGDVAVVDLPDDRDSGGAFDGRDGTERPTSLHYAPIDHDGVRRRVARLADWIAETRPGLMVIDVSVEVAMLARLASVPTVYVRLNGRRTDRPHLDAFRSATALLAPFHVDLDDERTPGPLRHKTFYAPRIVSTGPATHHDEDLVLGVVGRGGGPSDGELWAAAARAVPDRRWRIIGPTTVPGILPPNLELEGWVEDAERRVAQAGLVVGAAGDGLVSAVLAHARPFICIPEPRPFDEQRAKARRLSALGAAVVLPSWPRSDQWPSLVARASRLEPSACRRLNEPGGPARVARWLEGLADGGARTWTRSA